MPVISKAQAVDLLLKEVEEHFDPDELLEVYNEIFPNTPHTEEEAHQNPSTLADSIADYIGNRSNPEEVVDLWGLIFPTYRNVWYDEEENQLHYNEESESLQSE